MQTCRVLCLLALVTISTVGCKSKPTLVGEWSGVLTMQSINVDVSTKFLSGNVWQMTQSTGGRSSTQKGTYAEKEKSFEVTITGMDAPEATKEQLAEVNKNMAKNPTKVTFDIEWKDANTIVVNQQGARAPFNVPITLNRK